MATLPHGSDLSLKELTLPYDSDLSLKELTLPYDSDLSLKELTLKLTMLLALTSTARTSEIFYLDTRYLSIILAIFFILEKTQRLVRKGNSDLQ